MVSLLLTIVAAARLVQRMSAGGIESQQAPLGGIRMVGFLAAAAESAYQPLGDHTDQIAGEDFRVQAQIQQPCQSAQRRVGVERAENLVTGHRGPQRHGGRVRIANLAHQNDIGILPHHGTDAGRKINF